MSRSAAHPFLLGGVANGGAGKCSTAPVQALQVAAAGPLGSALCLASVLLLGKPFVSHAWPLAGEVVQQLGVPTCAGAVHPLPGLPPRWRLDRKGPGLAIPGSQRRWHSGAAGIGPFPSLWRIGMGHLFVLRAGLYGASVLILLAWFGLGARATTPAALAGWKAMPRTQVGRNAAARRFRVLDLMLPCGNLSQSALSDDSSLPAAGF